MLSIQAYAKLNLALEVLGRRGDGFHDLVSIMQTVELADTLRMRPAAGIVVRCSDKQLEGPGNLVERAARLLNERCRPRTGCQIELEKRIPEAAGLGGGSSDAAAALIGLRQLWNLPLGCADLLALAAELGSDVPFFLYGGTALVEGRGERVLALEGAGRRWYLLANPGVRVRTADVFAELRPEEWTSGERTRQMADDLRRSTRPVFGPNNLQDALFRAAPQAHGLYERIRDLAPGRTIVCGSGPTVAAAFDDEAAARRAAGELSGAACWLRVVPARPGRTDGSPCA